jgi:hypothetical protein
MPKVLQSTEGAAKYRRCCEVPKAGGHEVIADARGTGGPAKDAAKYCSTAALAETGLKNSARRVFFFVDTVKKGIL